MSVATPARTPTLTLALRTFDKEPSASWASMLDHARWADQAGIDRLVVSDHVVLGEDLDAHHASGGGTFPTPPNGAWLESFTVLTYLAAITSNVRLAPAVMIVPLRRPVVLAKAAATLDVLSGGRLELGVGIGWQREEYKAAGVPFERRGALLDDALRICRTLWTDSPASHGSADVSFDRIHCEPKPLQPGGVPLWLSGRLHPRNVARIVEFGTGWIPWAEFRTDVRLAVERLGDELEARGRRRYSVAVRHDVPVSFDGAGHVDVDRTLDPVPALIEFGVADFRLLTGPDGMGKDGERALAELVKTFNDIRG